MKGIALKVLQKLDQLNPASIEDCWFFLAEISALQRAVSTNVGAADDLEELLKKDADDLAKQIALQKLSVKDDLSRINKFDLLVQNIQKGHNGLMAMSGPYGQAIQFVTLVLNYAKQNKIINAELPKAQNQEEEKNQPIAFKIFDRVTTSYSPWVLALDLISQNKTVEQIVRAFEQELQETVPDVRHLSSLDSMLSQLTTGSSDEEAQKIQQGKCYQALTAIKDQMWKFWLDNENELPATHKQLLNKGFDLHATSNAGQTLLHYFVVNKQYELAVNLIALGANPFAKDNNGQTIGDYLRKPPLNSDSNNDAFKKLQNSFRTYDANSRDMTVNNVIFYATNLDKRRFDQVLREAKDLNTLSADGYLQILKLKESYYLEEILKKDANPNYKDKSGTTAFLLALQKREFVLARKMIERGDINLTIKDRSGKSASDHLRDILVDERTWTKGDLENYKLLNAHVNVSQKPSDEKQVGETITIKGLFEELQRINPKHSMVCWLFAEKVLNRINSSNNVPSLEGELNDEVLTENDIEKLNAIKSKVSSHTEFVGALDAFINSIQQARHDKFNQIKTKIEGDLRVCYTQLVENYKGNYDAAIRRARENEDFNSHVRIDKNFLDNEKDYLEKMRTLGNQTVAYYSQEQHKENAAENYIAELQRNLHALTKVSDDPKLQLVAIFLELRDQFIYAQKLISNLEKLREMALKKDVGVEDRNDQLKPLSSKIQIIEETLHKLTVKIAIVSKQLSAENLKPYQEELQKDLDALRSARERYAILLAGVKAELKKLGHEVVVNLPKSTLSVEPNLEDKTEIKVVAPLELKQSNQVTMEAPMQIRSADKVHSDDYLAKIVGLIENIKDHMGWDNDMSSLAHQYKQQLKAIQSGVYPQAEYLKQLIAAENKFFAYLKQTLEQIESQYEKEHLSLLRLQIELFKEAAQIRADLNNVLKVAQKKFKKDEDHEGYIKPAVIAIDKNDWTTTNILQKHLLPAQQKLEEIQKTTLTQEEKNDLEQYEFLSTLLSYSHTSGKQITVKRDHEAALNKKYVEQAKRTEMLKLKQKIDQAINTRKALGYNNWFTRLFLYFSKDATLAVKSATNAIDRAQSAYSKKHGELKDYGLYLQQSEGKEREAVKKEIELKKEEFNLLAVKNKLKNQIDNASVVGSTRLAKFVVEHMESIDKKLFFELAYKHQEIRNQLFVRIKQYPETLNYLFGKYTTLPPHAALEFLDRFTVEQRSEIYNLIGKHFEKLDGEVLYFLIANRFEVMNELSGQLRNEPRILNKLCAKLLEKQKIKLTNVINLFGDFSPDLLILISNNPEKIENKFLFGIAKKQVLVLEGIFNKIKQNPATLNKFCSDDQNEVTATSTDKFVKLFTIDQQRQIHELMFNSLDILDKKFARYFESLVKSYNEELQKAIKKAVAKSDNRVSEEKIAATPIAELVAQNINLINVSDLLELCVLEVRAQKATPLFNKTLNDETSIDKMLNVIVSDESAKHAKYIADLFVSNNATDAFREKILSNPKLVHLLCLVQNCASLELLCNNAAFKAVVLKNPTDLLITLLSTPRDKAQMPYFEALINEGLKALSDQQNVQKVLTSLVQHALPLAKQIQKSLLEQGNPNTQFNEMINQKELEQEKTKSSMQAIEKALTPRSNNPYIAAKKPAKTNVGREEKQQQPRLVA